MEEIYYYRIIQIFILQHGLNNIKLLVQEINIYYRIIQNLYFVTYTELYFLIV